MSACNAVKINVVPKARGSGDLYLDGVSRSDVVAGLDVHEVAVLTQAHWDRIQYQLKKKEIEAEKIRKIIEAREQLHQLSLDRVKDWKNTVYGQRQKKLEVRRLREEREENDRINVDVEEAKHQAKERKAAIERAKVQLYYQTDRVKELHSALLHAEALKERDVQLEIKRLKDKLSAEQDRQWYVQYKRDFEAFNDADQRQVQERRRKNMFAADYQKAQIRHHEDELEGAKEEDRKEGERLKKQAEEYEAEERQKAEETRRKALQQNAANRNQIEDVKFMKQVEETQYEEEDEECRVFAQAKRHMMKLDAPSPQSSNWTGSEMVSPQPRQRCPPLLGLEGERRMALLALLLVLVVGFVWSAGISQALDRFDDESEEGEHSDFENLVGFGRDVTDGPPVVSRVRRSRHRSGSTPLSGGRDAGQQQPPCAVAMSCDMQPLAGNVSSKEARRTFRVDSIKDEILRKLRLDSAPNITTRRQRDLNSMQRFFNQYQRGRYQPMMQPDEPNEEEYSTPISLIVQSQTVPRPAFNTSDACYFQLSSPAFRPNQVVSAQLGVFLRSRYGLAPPTDGSIRQLLVLRNYRRQQQQQQSVGRNYTGESYRSKMLNASNPNHFGRWHFFDVRSLVQAWINHPDRNWGITIAVSDSSLQPLVMVQPRRTAEEALRPFIEVKVRPSSGVRVTRSTGPDCSDDSQERRCCRYPLTIDFDAFRWDWIVAPKRYEAYYCAGECPFLHYQSNPHTHLIQQITPRASPCCAPTHVSSLPIIYMDDKAKRIFHMSIPGMIVDRCGCS